MSRKREKKGRSMNQNKGGKTGRIKRATAGRRCLRMDWCGMEDRKSSRSNIVKVGKKKGAERESKQREEREGGRSGEKEEES